MWPRSPLVIVMVSAAFVLAALYIIYRLVDPLPPRHLTIAAGIAGSGYDNFAKQYARILARDGVDLKIRNSAVARVQAATHLVRFLSRNARHGLSSLASH